MWKIPGIRATWILFARIRPGRQPIRVRHPTVTSWDSGTAGATSRKKNPFARPLVLVSRSAPGTAIATITCATGPRNRSPGTPGPCQIQGPEPVPIRTNGLVRTAIWTGPGSASRRPSRIGAIAMTAAMTVRAIRHLLPEGKCPAGPLIHHHAAIIAVAVVSIAEGIPGAIAAAAEAAPEADAKVAAEAISNSSRWFSEVTCAKVDEQPSGCHPPFLFHPMKKECYL